jgi:hypothetical protein
MYSSNLSLTLALDGGWVVNAMPQLVYPLERGVLLIVQEAEWAQGPVWTGEENLAPTRILPWTIQPLAGCYTD